MRKKLSTFLDLLFLIIIVSCLFLLPGTNATAEENSCIASECHTIATTNNFHPQDKKCSHCHKAPLAHPEENTPAVKNKALCLECHQKTFDHDNLHAPAAAGHCQACHTAHPNGNKFQIHKRDKSICYDCHDPVVKDGDTMLHGEIAKNQCGSCHAVHGSAYQNLLRANYSSSFFNDYTEEQYQLCFRCHKIDLLLHPKTSYNTNFRDGKRNLHYLHVNRSTKGRSCKFCHKIHSGREPKLMATTVSFGDWQMPVNFKINENGGKCSPGCHVPMSYDRGTKGISPTKEIKAKEEPSVAPSDKG